MNLVALRVALQNEESDFLIAMIDSVAVRCHQLGVILVTIAVMNVAISVAGLLSATNPLMLTAVAAAAIAAAAVIDITDAAAIICGNNRPMMTIHEAQRRCDFTAIEKPHHRPRLPNGDRIRLPSGDVAVGATGEEPEVEIVASEADLVVASVSVEVRHVSQRIKTPVSNAAEVDILTQICAPR